MLRSMPLTLYAFCANEWHTQQQPACFIKGYGKKGNNRNLFQYHFANPTDPFLWWIGTKLVITGEPTSLAQNNGCKDIRFDRSVICWLQCIRSPMYDLVVMKVDVWVLTKSNIFCLYWNPCQLQTHECFMRHIYLMYEFSPRKSSDLSTTI